MKSKLNLYCLLGVAMLTMSPVFAQDVATGAAVTPDTRFYVASATKSFTALSLAAMARRGEVDLDAPIVSVSLGLPVTFQFGGTKRGDPVAKRWVHDVTFKGITFAHANWAANSHFHPHMGSDAQVLDEMLDFYLRAIKK